MSDEHRIEWRKNTYHGATVYEAYVDGTMKGWLSKRPGYCDRGHWDAQVDVPHLDTADGFPRYFMRFSTAVHEMEEFLRWRLWKIRALGEASPDVFMDATQRIPK